MKCIPAFGWGVLALASAHADTGAKTATVKKTDHVHLSSKSCGYRLIQPALAEAHAPAPGPSLCAPPDVNLFVSDVEASGDLDVIVQDLPDKCFADDPKRASGWSRRNIPWVDNEPFAYPLNEQGCGDIVKTELVKPGVPYAVPLATVTKAQGQTYGFAAGALAIPFKLQLHGSNVAPGGSLGPYIGYKIGASESVGLSWVISGGISAGQSTTTSSGSSSSSPSTTSTSTTMNLYAATGFVANILGVQMGILAGQDLGARSSTTHRWWLSFGVGASFTN